MAQRMILSVKQSMMAVRTLLALAVAGRSVEQRPQASVPRMAWRKSEPGSRLHGSQLPEERMPHCLVKGPALPPNLFPWAAAHRDHQALRFCVALVKKMMYSYRLFHCRCLLKIISFWATRTLRFPLLNPKNFRPSISVGFWASALIESTSTPQA
jgi:hypothetical protein